ncbi:uncharacterized protein SCHCODRAFT_02627445 [Schizophyllum commune H4-8]|uniref:uncharacterized protein n=1 Tax=Schizophyllum commune (strain H4-8 / FGSC 9210) TaxID=578458 RepID=UPI0021604B1E|nr:uncharacterized protein SCHCODRAFT_02627445 [Schizophyllum commune H4-8]KAI5892900.1 hypothetical protein SCHCODRAFT_02627445 [Schizophyllum commune H4-8]
MSGSYYHATRYTPASPQPRGNEPPRLPSLRDLDFPPQRRRPPSPVSSPVQPPADRLSWSKPAVPNSWSTQPSSSHQAQYSPPPDVTYADTHYPSKHTASYLPSTPSTSSHRSPPPPPPSSLPPRQEHPQYAYPPPSRPARQRETRPPSGSYSSPYPYPPYASSQAPPPHASYRAAPPQASQPPPPPPPSAAHPSSAHGQQPLQPVSAHLHAHSHPGTGSVSHAPSASHAPPPPSSSASYSNGAHASPAPPQHHYHPSSSSSHGPSSSHASQPSHASSHSAPSHPAAPPAHDPWARHPPPPPAPAHYEARQHQPPPPTPHQMRGPPPPPHLPPVHPPYPPPHYAYPPHPGSVPPPHPAPGPPSHPPSVPPPAQPVPPSPIHPLPSHPAHSATPPGHTGPPVAPPVLSAPPAGPPPAGHPPAPSERLIPPPPQSEWPSYPLRAASPIAAEPYGRGGAERAETYSRGSEVPYAREAGETYSRPPGSYGAPSVRGSEAPYPRDREPRASPPPTTPQDAILRQLIEHCTKLYQFAFRYANVQQTVPAFSPGDDELSEMNHRAEEVVRLLGNLRSMSLTESERAKVESVSGSGFRGDEGSGFRGPPAPESHPSYRAPPALEEQHRVPKRPWEDMDRDSDGGQDELHTDSAADDPRSMAERDMETIRSKRASTTAGNAANVAMPKTKYRKRSKRASPPGKCHSCNIRETPEWRRGPDGARTLCNACGLHYAKLMRKRSKLNNGEAPHIDLETLRASARAADVSDKFARPKTASKQAREEKEKEAEALKNHQSSFQVPLSGPTQVGLSPTQAPMSVSQGPLSASQGSQGSVHSPQVTLNPPPPPLMVPEERRDSRDGERDRMVPPPPGSSASSQGSPVMARYGEKQLPPPPQPWGSPQASRTTSSATRELRYVDSGPAPPSSYSRSTK